MPRTHIAYRFLVAFLNRPQLGFLGVLRPAVHVDEIAAAVADATAETDLKGVRVLGTDELVGYRSSSIAPGWVPVQQMPA